MGEFCRSILEFVKDIDEDTLKKMKERNGHMKLFLRLCLAMQV